MLSTLLLCVNEPLALSSLCDSSRSQRAGITQKTQHSCQRRQGGRQPGQVWHCTHGGPDRWNLWEGRPSLMNTDVCRSVLSCCLFCCTLYAHHNPFITLPSCAPPFIFLRFTASLCSYLIFFRLFFFFFSRPSIVLMSPRLSEYEHRTSHNRYANKQIFWLDGYKRLQECPNVIGALHMKQRILAKMCTNYRTTANREWMYSCESIKSQTLQMHLHANSIEFTLRFFVCAVNCLIHCRPSAPHMPGSSARMEPRTGGGQTQASISYCSF